MNHAFWCRCKVVIWFASETRGRNEDVKQHVVDLNENILRTDGYINLWCWYTINILSADAVEIQCSVCASSNQRLAVEYKIINGGELVLLKRWRIHHARFSLAHWLARFLKACKVGTIFMLTNTHYNIFWPQATFIHTHSMTIHQNIKISPRGPATLAKSQSNYTKFE